VFALHTVPFPGMPLTLRVFEDRYRRLIDDVGPEGPFVIAAIRHGREVGGAAELHGVGVTVATSGPSELDDGTLLLDLVGRERVRLITSVTSDPYPVWTVAAFPDEGGAGTDDVAGTERALRAYLRSIGEDAVVPIVPSDPVRASYLLAAAAPGLPSVRQALLEARGAGERLAATREVFTHEARLVRRLGAGVAGVDLGVSPN